jgi:hypothetical protein
MDPDPEPITDPNPVVYRYFSGYRILSTKYMNPDRDPDSKT